MFNEIRSKNGNIFLQGYEAKILYGVGKAKFRLTQFLFYCCVCGKEFWNSSNPKEWGNPCKPCDQCENDPILKGE